MIAESAAVDGYETLGLLRSDQGIVSWRALRLEDNRICLLKCGQLEPARRVRFEREVHLLHSLDSTVRWSVSESRVVLSRAWRDPGGLSERLGGKPWPAIEVVELAVLCLEQLAAAHELGLVHGGIHPDNWLSELVDFALSRGSLAYAAPEAGFSWRAANQAGDLYSVGALLYHLSSGQPPSLRRHWEQGPAPLRKLAPGRPRALEEILQRLLHPDPAARYPRAQSALIDFRRLRTALQEDPDPGLLVQAGFVVRLPELARLKAHQRGLLLVVGSSGSGKSRLLEEAARSHSGLSFRASGRSPRAPLQVLNELAAQVVEALLSRSDLRTAFQSRLAGHRDTLVSSLPCLAALLGEPPAAGFAVENDEFLLESLLAWLSAIPGRIFLDDLQWADSLTWKLLQLCPAECCLVAAARERSEVVSAPVLVLGELDVAEVECLARSVMGKEVSPAFFRQLAEDSGGDLFLALEMMRGYAETGEACPQSSRRTALILRQRLDELPTETLELLGRAAVLGRQFQLQRLKDWTGRDVRTDLQPAVDSQVIWLLGGGETGCFAHDRLREACLAQLPDLEQARLHAAVAVDLEALSPADSYALSYHYGRSNVPERAFPYALAAAKDAALHFAYDLAEEHYRLALRSAGEQRAEQRLLVLQGLAETLLRRGRYQEAEAYYQAALQEDECQGIVRTRLWARLGYLELSRGQLPEAAGYTRQALASLGQSIPERPWRVALDLTRHGLGLAWNRLHRPRLQILGEQERLRLDLINQFSFLQFFVARPDLLLWGHLLSMRRAERFHDSTALSLSYSMHSIMLVTLSRYEASESYGTQSIEMARRLGDRAMEGRAFMHRALGRLYSGRLHEAWADYQQSRQLASRAMQRWDENVLQQNESHLLYQQGKLVQASQAAADLYQRGMAQGDRMAMAASVRYWVRCTGGAAPRIDFGEHGDLVARLYLCEVEGLRCYFQGRHHEAAGHLRQAISIPAPGMEKATTWAWLVTAERRATGACDPNALRRALSLARKYPLVLAHARREAGWEEARRGNTRKARQRLDESLASALRLGQVYEQALTLQARARIGEVFGWSERAADESRSQQLFYEISAWWELPATAQVGPALADRYQQMLEKGAPIAASLSETEVHQRLLEAARVLLRAEKVELLTADSDLPLVGRALQAGQVVLGRVCDQHEREVLAGVRSALACPVHAGLCLYACHSGLTDHFGEDELRLARFLTTLAATALENASLHGELSQREAYFRALFYGPELALAVVDHTGTVREDNEAMKRLREGRTLVELLHPDEWVPFQELLREHRQASWETRYRGPQSLVLWAQVTLSPIQDGLTVLAISDVSYRKFKQIVLFAESERRLLGSELHDVISQPIFGLSLLLQTLERDPRPELLRRASEACSSLSEKLGSLMTGLRTPPLAGAQLARSLEVLVWQSGRDGGYQPSLDCRGGLEQVPELTAIFLFRILQESLQNIGRHASARHVEVRLEASGDRVIGSVRDDGVGCEPEAVLQSSRHGLRGMTERAELLGGWLRVSNPGGLLVEFELPGRHAL